MDFVIRQQKLPGSFPLWVSQSADFILDHQVDEHLKHFSRWHRKYYLEYCGAEIAQLLYLY